MSNKALVIAFLGTAALALLGGCGAGVEQSQPRSSVPSISGGYGESNVNAANVKPAASAQALQADYYGHQALRLTNGLVTVVAVPDFGGRVMEYKLGDKPLIWANLPLVKSSNTTTAPATPAATAKPAARVWKNWGGYKAWPAPQTKWGGPPDPAGSDLEGGRWTGRITKPRGDVAEIELLSPDDAAVTGLQITRHVRLYVGSTHVQVEETYKNVSTHPIDWSIWRVTEVPGSLATGEKFSDQAHVYFPINPKSRFSGGYHTLIDQPSDQWRVIDKDLMQVSYHGQLGKIGADSMAGWVSYVDDVHGFTFTQCFTPHPGADYPDSGCSVEVYTDPTLAYMEVEVLSPMHKLAPGQEASSTENWYATHVGGPTRDVTEAAAIREPIALKRDGAAVTVSGSLGVFAPGKLKIATLDASGKDVGKPVEEAVSPAEAVKLGQKLPLAEGATKVDVSLLPGDGGQAQTIASLALPEAGAAGGSTDAGAAKVAGAAKANAKGTGS